MFNIVRTNNQQGLVGNTININGKEYQYRDNDGEEEFVVFNYKGKTWYKMSVEEFMEEFMNNSNQLYFNQDYYTLAKGKYED